MNDYIPQPLRIISIERETEIDWTFSLSYDKPLVGGQFFQLSIPGVGEAPISVSEFGNGQLHMTIRNVGRLTAALFKMKAGDVLYARGPYGNGFDLSLLAGSDLIVIAGGTGLAPVRHIINHFMDNPDEVASLSVIAGFKSPADCLFRADLSRWKEQGNVIVTVDKAVDGWNGEVGLVTQFIANLAAVKSPNARAIVVGPPIMMKFATLELIKNGLNEDRLFVSFERNMSCGLGKCGHCKIDETYVCVEGPVFPYTKARNLLD